MLYKVTTCDAQLVLPKSGAFRFIILSELHSALSARKFGARKTLAALLKHFYCLKKSNKSFFLLLFVNLVMYANRLNFQLKKLLVCCNPCLFLTPSLSHGVWISSLVFQWWNILDIVIIVYILLLID